MSEERKALPSALLKDQFRVRSYKNIRDSPWEKDEGTQDMTLETKDGKALYFSIDRGRKDNKYNMPGIDSYQELIKLTEPEFEERHWSPEGIEDLHELESPAYEEMDELRNRYQKQLENASTKQEERDILAEMWGEAAEMDLEGRTPFGVKQ